jgi:hypothetical protein
MQGVLTKKKIWVQYPSSDPLSCILYIVYSLFVSSILYGPYPAKIFSLPIPFIKKFHSLAEEVEKTQQKL